MSMLASAVPLVARNAYPLSVDAYHDLIADGTLDENDPVELVEGELLFKMPKKRDHRRTTKRLDRWLDRVLPAGWETQVQDPIALPTSEPEPDVCCVTVDGAEYADPHPGVADIALVVEVSDSTLAYDRSRKLRMYARAGIVEYWIVNLIDRQIEVYTQPVGDAYASRVIHAVTDTIALPATLGGATIAVADLLPPA